MYIFPFIFCKLHCQLCTLNFGDCILQTAPFNNTHWLSWAKLRKNIDKLNIQLFHILTPQLFQPTSRWIPSAYLQLSNRLIHLVLSYLNLARFNGLLDQVRTGQNRSGQRFAWSGQVRRGQDKSGSVTWASSGTKKRATWADLGNQIIATRAGSGN